MNLCGGKDIYKYFVMSGSKRKWLTGSFLEKFDNFGEPVPAFNVKGEDMHKTRIGGACSLVIGALVLLFASIKFTHLTSKYNPQMSSYLKDLEELETLKLSEMPNF